MLPRSVLAVPASAPSQHLRGGGTGDGMCFATLGLRPAHALGIRNAPPAVAHMCVPGQEAGGTLGLQEQLDQAVREERYEDAARLRDLIKTQGGPHGAAGAAAGQVPPAAAAGESVSDLREKLRQREISRLRDIDTDGDNMATPF